MTIKTKQSRRQFVAGTLALSVTACGKPDGTDLGQSPNEAHYTPQKNERLNILYITADDLGTRLGAYGHDIDTPNIDALSEQGLLFEECHAQSGICGGSRTSILTGLRPETSGVDQNRDPWRGVLKNTVTLPRHFKDNGYYTFGLGKIEDGRNGELDDPWTFRRKIRLQDTTEVSGFFR